MAHRFLPNIGPSEVFYGGAAGGGKSDWLLDSAAEYADVPGYAAIIFRRTYTDLALPGAIMARAKQWWGTKFWNETQKTFTFPGADPAASLTFAYLRSDADVYRYQSAEFHYVGFDELTQFTEFQYTYLFSRLRRPAIKCSGCQQMWPCDDHPDAPYDPVTPEWVLELSKVPLRMCSASNPGGIGHGWVKKRFPIDGKPRGQRVFIPAKLTDNAHVDQRSYTSSLKKLSPALAQQLLEGDWDIFEGMAYPEISESLHAVPMPAPSTIDGWARHEGMDHGVSNPTAWLLFLTDYDGNVLAADEYYAPGLPSQHAAAISDRRREWWERRDDGWPVKHAAYGDPASLRESLPTENRLGDPLTLQDEYRKYGIALVPGNNRRRAGFVHLRELLEPSCACSEEPLAEGAQCEICAKTSRRRFPLWHPLGGKLGAPRMFVVKDRCPELWTQLADAPIAMRELDPNRGEAVDAQWEGDHGHAHAACRYGTLTPERQARERDEERQEPEDPRARVLAARAQRRKQESRAAQRRRTHTSW